MMYNKDMYKILRGCLLGSCILAGCQRQSFVSVDATCAWKPVSITSVDACYLKTSLSGKYTLLDLLDIGLKKNPNTKQAWWQSKMALAQKGQSDAAFLPTLALDTNVARSYLGAYQNQEHAVHNDALQAGLSLTYKIFQFGTDAAQAKSALHALYAANYAFNDCLQSVVYQIQKAFYEYQCARAKIEAAKSSLKDAEQSFEAVSKKKENGLARLQDWLLAQSEMLKARYDLQSAEAALESCRANLSTVIGLPIGKGFEITNSVSTAERKHLMDSAETLMQDALTKRSDLLAAEEQLEAKKWALKSTKRSHLPNVYLSADAHKVRRRGADWQNQYKLALGVSLNIFNGGYDEYKSLEAYAAFKAQAYSLHQKKLSALQEAWSVFHACQSSLKLVESAKALETASSEALEAIRIGYDAGINNLLDLLSAQKSLSNARFKNIQAQADLSINFVRLAYVTGHLDSNNPMDY